MRTTFSTTSFDVIVIGAGPGGLSCAMWCADLGISTLLVDVASDIGGQLHWIHNSISNHLGALEAKDGSEFLARLRGQVERRDFDLILGVAVDSVDCAGRSIRLADGRAFEAKAIVISTGVSRRHLGIPGEIEFAARGVLDSGAKNRNAMSGKKIVVIGGGDAALENAVILSDSADSVTLVHRKSAFSAQKEFLNQVAEKKNIRVMTPFTVTSINGSEHVTSVSIVSHSGETVEIPADAVLVRVGFVPNSAFLLGALKLDDYGYLQIDSNSETSIPQIFAIGDVTNRFAPTISSAVGQGALVAKVLHSRLNG